MRVTFVGYVPHADLPDWYRAADLTVLPSRSEGIPNVLLESIACGTPFVASRVGGIPEVADPLVDRLVAPGDRDALASAIIHALIAPSRINRRTMPVSAAHAGERLLSVLASTMSGRQIVPSGRRRQPGVAAGDPVRARP
jgi:glycosyltransferase involved in cell wall biosynthesis